MESLEKIKSYKPSMIYPGHGPVVIDPVAIIDHYITHRLSREIQVLLDCGFLNACFGRY